MKQKRVLNLPAGEVLYSGHEMGEYVTEGEYNDWIFSNPDKTGDKMLDIERLTCQPQKGSKFLIILPSGSGKGSKFPKWSRKVLDGLQSGIINESMLRNMILKKDEWPPAKHDRVLVCVDRKYYLWSADDDRLAPGLKRPLGGKSSPGQSAINSKAKKAQKPESHANKKLQKRRINSADISKKQQAQEKIMPIEQKSSYQPQLPYAITWSEGRLTVIQSASGSHAAACVTKSYARMNNLQGGELVAVDIMSLSGNALTLDGETLTVKRVEKLLLNESGAELYFILEDGNGAHLSCGF